MSLLRFLPVLTLSVLCSCATVSKQPQIVNSPKSSAAPAQLLDATVYKLASGDTVRIDVLTEADLSLKALIDPVGLINYPFLGRLQAAGLTVGQLEKRIYSGLKAGFLVNPDVRVSIAEYRPIYVSGQVRQAGIYPYSLGLTVAKVLTLAGGITSFGSTSRIYLQRAGKQNEDREKAELDGLVYPGDAIVVEERLF